MTILNDKNEYAEFILDFDGDIYINSKKEIFTDDGKIAELNLRRFSGDTTKDNRKDNKLPIFRKIIDLNALK